MAVQKKREEKVEETREIIADDVVVKTTGNVEVIEEALKEEKPEEKVEEKSEEKKAEEIVAPQDPLTNFKEKMIKEEYEGFDAPKKKSYMWPILLIFIIAVLILVGIFLYKRSGIGVGGKAEVAKVTPSPAVSVEPTKAVDLSKYEIEVQNGSGVDGEASKQKADLEAAGFTVSSVGNADNSDYTDTIIKAQKNVDKDFIAKLKETLSTSFTVGDTETLPDSSSTPVVVIIGTKK